MNTEMNNTIGVSVTSLLLKTLENATKEYARECIMRCAQAYGFDSEEALRDLNLENLTIQVREMKKRSAGQPKKKAEKKIVEKPKEEKKKAEKKASIPLPFVASMVNEDGCGGLAYNCGLFTQCQKIRMSQSEYCKGCQSEADMSASGTPSTGTVKGRLAVGMMEFRDGKGRAPVAYTKIMEKQKLDRETVEQEAGKLNIEIDELHFAVVEEKKKAEKAGRPKQAKKVKTVTAETVEDLFAQLIDEEDESLAPTVVMSDSEGEEEELSAEEKEKRSANEKAERGMMKEADTEMKKIMQAEAKKLAKEQKMAADLQAKELAKEAKIAADLAAKAEKEQRLADEKAAREQKLIDDKLAKEAKIVADKLAKEQKLIDDKLAKEAKIVADLLAKEQAKAAREQKLIDDKLAKEAKIAADLLAKEQAKEKKIADELAAKAAKEQKLIDDKLAKEAKIAADLLAKEQAKEKKIADELAAKAAREQKMADELAAKEAKKQQMAAEKVARDEAAAQKKAEAEQKKAEAEQKKAAKDAEPKKQKEGTRTIVASEARFKVGDRVEYRSAKGEVSVGSVTEVKMGKSFVEYDLKMEDGSSMRNAPEGNIMAAKEPSAAAAPKKVTVKRITIGGKQYLKTADNLLYDPETKEEMGIYDPETNTIKELPEEDDDEIEEDGYDSDN